MSVALLKKQKKSIGLKRLVNISGYLGVLSSNKNQAYILRTRSKVYELEVNEFLFDSLVNLIGERVKLRGITNKEGSIKVISVSPVRPLILVNEDFEEDDFNDEYDFDYLRRRIRSGYLMDTD